MSRKIPGRFRTAAAKNKALAQYEDLKASGVVTKAIVIAGLSDGSVHVLGQETTPAEMAPLLAIAVETLAQADAGRRVVRLVSHIEPERRGEHNRSKPQAKEIRTADDGTLIPPPGENFISCGECAHPTWFVLHFDNSNHTSRMACAHCGNEVKNILITHGEGHA